MYVYRNLVRADRSEIYLQAHLQTVIDVCLFFFLLHFLRFSCFFTLTFVCFLLFLIFRFVYLWLEALLFAIHFSSTCFQFLFVSLFFFALFFLKRTSCSFQLLNECSGTPFTQLRHLRNSIYFTDIFTYLFFCCFYFIDSVQ